VTRNTSQAMNLGDAEVLKQKVVMWLIKNVTLNPLTGLVLGNANKLAL
jgi:hypothetical protein